MAAWTDGASALVLGASGGIGRAFAEALRQRSDIARVFGSSRNAGRLPAGVEPLELDVTDLSSIAAAGEALRAATPRIDVVLFCIGVLHDEEHGIAPEKRLEDVDARALTRSFAVNAVAPLLLAREIVSLLPRRDPCVWGNLSARVGSIGDNRLGGWYSYRASKAAQNMITRNLAIELGRRHRGIACVALHPGTVATALSAPFRSAEADGVMTADAAVTNLLAVIGRLTVSDNGKFFAWDGSEIIW